MAGKEPKRTGDLLLMCFANESELVRKNVVHGGRVYESASDAPINTVQEEDLPALIEYSTRQFKLPSPKTISSNHATLSAKFEHERMRQPICKLGVGLWDDECFCLFVFIGIRTTQPRTATIVHKAYGSDGMVSPKV